LNTILLHAVLCLDVTVHHSSPEGEALVLYLSTDLEKRTNESQTVHYEPELLNRLNEIDRCNRRRRAETSKHELAKRLGDIIPVAVISDEYVSPMKKFVQDFNHVIMAVLPFRREDDLTSISLNSGETEQTTCINQLIGRDILIPHSPNVSLCRLPFDVII
jgi:hypothetical protein